MILGIGIDSVEIDRFKPWTKHSKERLLRIFSEHEIAYSLSNSKKTAERLAARFAAKEAFFKACALMAPGNDMPFLTLCKLVSVESLQNEPPKLLIDWQALSEMQNVLSHDKPTFLLSITHTDRLATAIAIIERNRPPIDK